jgi:hypothetical protein
MSIMTHHSQRFILSIILTSALASTGALAACEEFCHPFYAGISAGYGSTTWEGLVPSEENQNGAMVMAVPVDVSEGGAVWGLFAGYELIPYFAIEAAYMRYPNAKVTFDPDSIFTFNNEGITYLSTHAESASVMGKIMLVIPHTKIRAYSSAGVAVIHRWDNLNDHNRGTPTFGLGINYNVAEHVMLELGGSYTAGYGESEIEPVNDYMPFLYAAFLRLAYRF